MSLATAWHEAAPDYVGGGFSFRSFPASSKIEPFRARHIFLAGLKIGAVEVRMIENENTVEFMAVSANSGHDLT